MKRLLGATLLIVDLMSLLFALFAPLASPWWFIFSFVVLIVHIAYGFEIQSFAFKLLD